MIDNNWIGLGRKPGESIGGDLFTNSLKQKYENAQTSVNNSTAQTNSGIDLNEANIDNTYASMNSGGDDALTAAKTNYYNSRSGLPLTSLGSNDTFGNNSILSNSNLALGQSNPNNNIDLSSPSMNAYKPTTYSQIANNNNANFYDTNDKYRSGFTTNDMYKNQYG